MHIRNVLPKDFHSLLAFDMTPLPQLRTGELRLFISWCAPLSFVLLDGQDQIAGAALALRSTDGATAFLHYLVVASSARNQGWGARLLDHVERAGTEKGAQRMALYTKRAAGYYRKRGYDVATEPVPDHLGAQEGCASTGQYLSKVLSNTYIN